MSIISTDSTSSHLTKPFIFHAVHTSRTGYVKKTCTMLQLRTAAVDFVKSDATVENREQFSSPQVFASHNPVVLPMEEPKDNAKAKTVCPYPTSSGVVFVPAPIDMPPQYQPSAGHNDATASLDVRAILDSLQKAATLQLETFKEEFQKTNDSKIDALQQKLEAVQEDNEDLKEQVTTLKEEGEKRKQEIAALKSETVDLRGRIAELEREYEDVHGWLSDKDTGYMDRIRLRHILDCGQARLAQVAKIPVSNDYPSLSTTDWSRAWRHRLSQCADNAERLAKARSILADCDDPDTRDMPDDVLGHFTVKPSDTRLDGDRTAHPEKVGEQAYKGVVERQPEGQRPLLRQVIAYGLKFHLDSN
ncbi:hypothetical protein IW261DRAFT_1509982 [Armillaria novae-zelandiae]|uniref:Uncharacterized protein n=1 Tax=Armillaria novae-zelandiae TaxID=153914 RepID=A0AA39NUF7_9AGAR|nr:hypothetical protein IW261DRAFT_1509982 [Armillaria novae-zelandiae]